jgi:hypothetical protein
MAVTLNSRAYVRGQEWIREGHVVRDDRDDWSEHQPTADQENEFIETHGYSEYALWHLGLDDEQGEQTKGRYKFPYGDFKDVHRCGVIAAEVRAARQHYDDIQVAAAHLHGMIDAGE